MTRTLVAVTGASRGFGRAVASQFASRHTSSNSTDFVLIARSQPGLDEIKDVIRSISPRSRVDTAQIDLADSNVRKELSDAFRSFSTGSAYEQSILINNAACVQPLKPFDELSGPALLQPLLLSVSAGYEVTREFLRVPSSSRRVVHVSSKLALMPCDLFTAYCVSKAAGDALHRSIAQETAAKVLNYAPGPLRTAMLDDVIRSQRTSSQRSLWEQTRAEALEPDESARRLVSFLVSGEFESGAHVDYYDLSSH
eukprot:CAMPEP_0198733974 /NCGR_PEP_ID=MMETSP1475-20131203/49564_1 /TAXON_ID= ORGANISM="Unidentified sp., Strain CCMP1999" /NCGR_SAMPLE_ID=MMETSP1475 /ASSEMBLY_ACC=CAM_ASM_001111 /LENGTH=253 /DNA_ID=CAMNT_0044497365 /DNA_START=35 /DNA_END=796 /DNA_ORIENTATION=-